MKRSQQPQTGNLLWRLLRKNISASQIIGYAAANLVGLAIMMIAMQFYRDTKIVISGNRTDRFVTSDYIVISKKVAPLGSFLGAADTGFTDREIADLTDQQWVAQIGRFTSSQFDVTASVNFGGREFSTAMFFESIPDEFFDIKPNGWEFSPESNTIPIILSKDYLSLYNFGFAVSRGLPQLSEQMIAMIPLRISVSGNGNQTILNGRIVGFSSRLNTIAVPETFMNWANNRFGEQPAEYASPSRLIVEISSPGDPAIETYLTANDIETAEENSVADKFNYLMRILTVTVASIGLIICTLAVFILLLSIYLLIQKNQTKLHALMLLGFTPARLTTHYARLIVSINIAVAIATTATIIAATHLWRPSLASLDLTPAPIWPTILTAIVIITLITAINILTIHRLIRRCW